VRQVQATPDGRFVVFESTADLTGIESTQPQVFEYDAESEELTRVSVGAGEAEMENANENGSVIETHDYEEGHGPSATEAETGLAVSEGGSSVLFISGGALTSNVKTVPGVTSVYEYRSEGPISDGEVYLISDGVNTENAFANGLDESGVDAFFVTTDSLLPRDVDTQYDIYDARVDGGFAEPDPLGGCEGCGGSSLVQQSFGVPASESLTGAGSVSGVSSSGSVSSGSVGVGKVGLSRSGWLRLALRGCARERGRRRVACVSLARRRFGAGSASAKKSSRRGK
jgi:hypothetical protein